MPFPIFFIITLTGFLVVKQGPSSQKKRKKSDKDTDDETAWTRAKQEEKQNSWETPWTLLEYYLGQEKFKYRWCRQRKWSTFSNLIVRETKRFVVGQQGQYNQAKPVLELKAIPKCRQQQKAS